MMNIKYISSGDEDFSLVKSIRTEVFTMEQGADAKGEFDKYDLPESDSLYALLFEDNEALATARLALTDKGYKIGRIAVKKSQRGKGLGEKIVRAVCDKAFEKGADTVLVDAQNYAVPFYEKFGFEVIGDEIFDRGLPHMPMSLDKNNYK
ncbi:MAG: GNAT family N-acetyltransferase [Eubacteriales bacterium]|nr:GNAT family N-acetyltransferase [Eubacteriales bacterium]